MSKIAQTAKTFSTITVQSGLKSIIPKIEVDSENLEIRFFFKKTTTLNTRLYFEKNLARCFRQIKRSVPKITSLFSDSEEDTSQDPYHIYSSKWTGLIDCSDRPRVLPVWKSPDSIPPFSVRLKYDQVVEDFFDSILLEWGSSTPTPPL